MNNFILFNDIFDNLKKEAPLVHCITNYVSANFVADVVVSVGAKVIMADEYSEITDIVKVSNGLYVNIGTINKSIFNSILIATNCANIFGKPICIDIVGIGISSLRKELVFKLLNDKKIAVIHGNFSEINTILHPNYIQKGIDVNDVDIIKEQNLDNKISTAKSVAKKYGIVVVVSGKIDIITDGYKTYCIYNGSEYLSKIVGTGCSLTGLITAFVSANPNNILLSSVMATCIMGIAGEIAYDRMDKYDGSGSFKRYLLDAISNMNVDLIEMKSKIDEK